MYDLLQVTDGDTEILPKQRLEICHPGVLLRAGWYNDEHHNLL